MNFTNKILEKSEPTIEYDAYSKGYISYYESNRGIVGQGNSAQEAKENLNFIVALYVKEDRDKSMSGVNFISRSSNITHS